MDGALHTRANISAKNIAGTNLRLRMFCFEMSLKRRQLRQNYCPNVFTIPIMAMGCRQCLPFSVVQLKGKHCQKTHGCNMVVDIFGHNHCTAICCHYWDDRGF